MKVKITLLMLLSILLVNCSSDDNSKKTVEIKKPAVPVLEFNNKEVQLQLDEKTNLIYELAVQNVDLVDLVWSISNPDVLAIQGTTVYAKKEGESEVTVKVKKTELSASIKVKVNLPKEAKVYFKKEKLEIDGKLNKTIDLKELLVLENITLDDIVWRTNDSSKATLDNGVATVLRDGEVGIEVDIKGTPITARIILSIKGFGVYNLEINRNYPADQLRVNEQFQYTVQGTPHDSSDLKQLVWTSSNEHVVTVDNTGLVTAKTVGNSTVTVTAPNGAFAKVLVEVTGEVTIIRLDVGTGFNGNDLISGEKGFIFVNMEPANAGYTALEFISDKPHIATIDQEGYVTGIKGKEGTVNITVRSRTNPNVKSVITIQIVNRFYKFKLSSTLSGKKEGNIISGLISLTVYSHSIYDDTMSELKVYNKHGVLIHQGFESVRLDSGMNTHTYSFVLDNVEEPYITYKLEQYGHVEYRKHKLQF